MNAANRPSTKRALSKGFARPNLNVRGSVSVDQPDVLVTIAGVCEGQVTPIYRFRKVRGDRLLQEPQTFFWIHSVRQPSCAYPLHLLRPPRDSTEAALVNRNGVRALAFGRAERNESRAA